MSLDAFTRNNCANLRLPRWVQTGAIALLIQTLVLAPFTRADIIPATVDASGVLTGNYGSFDDTYAYSGVDVTTIDGNANVVIAAPGQYQNLNPTSHDAIANSLTTNYGFVDIEASTPITLSQHLTNYGQLSDGAQLNLGDFTNSGVLEVWGNPSQLLINGNFTNLNGSGLLSGGNYYIDSNSNLTYTGVDIKALDAGTYLTLGNTQSAAAGQVLNLSGGSHDAVLNSLADIYGTFSVNAVLTLNPAVTVHDGGTLQADKNGQLTLAGGLTNLDANGLLSGGNYQTGSDTKLIYTGADIQTLAANTSLTFTNYEQTTSGQILNLTGGSHDAIANSLTTSYGAIWVNNNAQLTLNQKFTNEGTEGLYLDTGGNITFNGGFGNVDGTGTLRTGWYVMGAGSSLTYTGADIKTIAADASLVFDNSNGTVNGQILNLTGGSHDAVINSLTDNYGNIQVQNNAQVTFNQSFTNHDGATLFTADGGWLTLGGGFTNVHADGTLANGTYYLGANSGLIYTGADIQAIDASANLTLDNNFASPTGQILNLTGGSHDALANSLAHNYGAINLWNGAQLTLNQTFTNHDGASMNIDGISQFATSGSLINAGSMDVAGKVSAQQGMQQSGSLTIEAGGELTLGAGATFTQTAGTTTVDGTLDPAAIDIYGGALNGSGTVDGNMVVGGADVSQTGVVTPGDNGNAGTLTVNGDYTQNSTGELDIMIDGLNQGVDYSFLDISGAASLGGYLNLTSFIDLTAGETFTILEANSINGTFSSSSFAGLDPSLTYSLIYQNQDVELSIGSVSVATPEPGTFALLGGMLAIAGLARRRRKTQKSA